ncbi:PKD domain protein [Ostertagia ostertagi]
MVLIRKSLIALCLLLIGLVSFITRSGAQACPPPTGVSASPVSACLGNPITLSATIPSGTTTINWYTVSSGGTAIATTTSASTTYTPTAAGTYTFYAEAASSSGGGSGTPQTFSYTGAVQSVTLPSGTYTLECWGANGGGSQGGKGGYSTGTLTLSSATTIYVVVGGAGGSGGIPADINGGYNGGGPRPSPCGATRGSGGGATHIATATGLLSTLSGNQSAVIIVAGAGGGGSNAGAGVGYGGGLTGQNSNGPNPGLGGTQTAGGAAGAGASGSPGTFGQGANPDATGNGYVRITPLSSGCVSTRVATAVVTVYALPTVAITPATADICSGSSIGLTASGATSYSWSPATGLSATVGNAVTASPTTTTTYTVTGTSANSCTATATRTVTVSAAPVAGTLAGTQTICAGSTTIFSVSGNSATGTWSSGSTGVATVSSTGVVTGVSAGTDTITYTVTGTGACSNATATRIVTVNPLPVATATAAGPTAFCTGGSVVLNANTATGINYRWLRNNIVITGATASAYTATTTANYAVVVTNTATGCADTSRPAIAVTVSTIPANTLSFTGTLTFCQGSSVRLQAAAGTGYTYVWYKDSGIIPGATTSSYTATAAGVYYVVITNGSCSTTSITRTVAVNPLPTATATPAGPTAFCNGGSVIIDANTGTGLTYQWQLGTTNIPGATSPSYTATASGTYSVVVSNGILYQYLRHRGRDRAPSFCQGGSVTLNATTGAGYTYQWLINSNPIPAATGASYSAAASGNYSVAITNGTCVATSAPFTVSVTPAPPAIVTPAGPTTFCQGGSVLLNTNRGSGYSYQWTKNNINIPGATSWQYTAACYRRLCGQYL